MEGSSSAAREDGRYLRRLKAASTGDADARLVFLCNFEAEEQWAVGHTGLPAPRFPVSAALVRRMEELGATLAGPRDVLLLSAPLDEDFRTHARSGARRCPRSWCRSGPRAARRRRRPCWTRRARWPS